MQRKNPEPIKYTSQINFRATPPLAAAVATAANAGMCSINSWIRAACLLKLKAEGHRLPTEREAA
jgi:predicted HicB family RNase H-like nuclease